MSLKSSTQDWGSLAKGFHWLSAVLIIGMIFVGIAMVNFIEDAGIRFDLYQMHKTFGFVVLTLIVLRLTWCVFDRRPLPPSSSSLALQRAASALHLFFYIAILSMILTGWLMVSTSLLPIPVSIFGLFNVPFLTTPDAELEIKYKALHHIIGWFLLCAIFIHIAAALKHHFVDKDNVLKRMLPFASKKEM
jgi:cytochrome b561